ncbi:trypsin I-P1-like isoform X1 [Harmonia axyridis]|uniref:trypsin I-P1-like isoform X1 n=1 Tax=Harmonia axyridis TaxID=115357 RepID=UPI001E277416|nr:trypsin I-P1-like isoform X1 [Harmonia axyridis]
MYYKLMVLIVFRFIVHSFTLSNIDSQLKIIGGLSVRSRSDFPYQVSLRYIGHHLCGGSIISRNLILTAAHCCFHEKKLLRRHNLKVVAGDLNIRRISNKTEHREVSEVFVHPGYNEELIENDIALWKVSSDFIWNEDIQPIDIAYKKFNAYTRCNISGWGVTNTTINAVSSNLKFVEVPLISRSKCQKFYPEIVRLNVICAGSTGKDSCQGDSGGPLVCNKTVAGIVSYGEECGIYPGVYTDVYAYRYWIKNMIRAQNSGLRIAHNYFLILVILFVSIFCRIINQI